MSKHLEKAKQLRSEEYHYNCAQAVLGSFSDVTGLTEEQAFKVALDFGGGIKHGDTCGSICGGAMVMGFLGIDDHESIAKLHNVVADKNEGCYQCYKMCEMCVARGENKKAHCNDMVYTVVEFIDSLIEK